MNNERFENIMKSSFHEKFSLADEFKADTKRKLLEKQERRSNILLCVLQVALLILTISIITIFSVFFGVIQIFLLLIGYLLAINLLGLVITLFYSKNMNFVKENIL